MGTHRTGRRRRAGFSLIELTLVILIMGILAGVAVIAVAPRVLAAKERVTKTNMRMIKNELESYYVTNNVYPATLEGLVPGYLQRVPRDGWKRDFFYMAPGLDGRPFELRSYGEDGEPNTADDLDIWVLEQEE